ncbi:MAG: NAD(P)/FAD-dependent oxidoreductase [Streptosporangiales bacterium]|nr:NAD(P)/FAD-dependent oxidoreductase [Streptosporangiales bacterium]
MAVEDVDVVVVGMGPGGEDVAGRLAEAGLSVIGVEAKLLGGECPYWGCVPSKMMIRAADLLAETHRVPGMAGTSTAAPDWTPVARRIRQEATDTWDDKVAVDRFVGKGGQFVRGSGRITAPGEVTVAVADKGDGQGDRVFRARRGIVLATGTEPAAPPIDGLAGTPYWTNREAIETEVVPESLIVLGGGAIGSELVQVFARFGARVTVVEAVDRLLPGDEPEAGALLAEVFAREGIEVHTGALATQVRHDGDRFDLTLKDGTELSAERLLVATGRRADLAALGVGAVGIDESGKAIPVDEHLRAATGVWALGDVTGKGAFTHMAVYQAGIVAADILGERTPSAEYHAVPRVTFTDPEIGAVGLTEGQARELGLRVRIGSAPVPSSARGWIHKAGNDGFIKLVEDVDRGVLVGATSAGPNGGEVLGALSVAVHAAVPTDRLRQMIYAYPTFHRAIEDALRELG